MQKLNDSFQQIVGSSFFFGTSVHWETGYLQLIDEVINSGVVTEDRTGIGCRKFFDINIVADLRAGFPISTVRNCPWRYSFHEFWCFLRGETDIDPYLQSKGIKFWQEHTSREFLDKRGLSTVPTGNMGKAYGYQLRRFGKTDDLFSFGVDQLRSTINGLLMDPYSRRHYVTMWNPSQLNEMALPPCWHSHQFFVEAPTTPEELPTLHLKVFSRSADLVFGTPFNVQQYALYLECMSRLVGMEPGILSCNMVDAHVYENQIEFALEMIERETFGMPTLNIHKPIHTMEQMLSLQEEDFEFVGLRVNDKPFSTPKPPMAV